MPELFPEGGHVTELAVSMALGGKEIADLRGTGYKGEWGKPMTTRNIFGDKIKSVGFNTFEYKGGKITIPVQAWDIDLEGPPIMGKEVADELYERGEEIIRRTIEYIVDFVEEFQKVNIEEALKSKD